MFKKMVLFCIKFYQKTLSFDHGLLKYFSKQPRCKFHPTCSQYMYEAIDRFGMFKGIFLGAKRIGRCHPWSMGGMDPIPPLRK